MTTAPTTLATVLIATAALAQTPPPTTVSVVAATPIAAATSVGGGPATFNGIPQNQTIGVWPNNLLLSTSQSTPAGGWLYASTACYPTISYNSGIGVNFFERAMVRGPTTDQSGSSASAQPQGMTFGPHAILATFRNQPGVVGKIIMSFRASTAATGTTGMTLDIGNDNSVELQSAVSVYREFPITFGPAGAIDVLVTNDCFATGDGTAANLYSWTEAWIAFMPDLTATCTFTNYGTGCGPTANGGEIVIGTNRVITMLVTGCFPNSPVIAATGTQQLNVTLPGGCTLLTNALGITIVNADGAGNASESWTVPVTAVGRTYHQFLPIALQNGNLVISASNGVRVDCVR